MTRIPPKPPRPHAAPLAVSPVILELERRVVGAGAGTPEGAALIQDFWAGAGARSPLVEPVVGERGSRLVTFLWRDADAERVLLFVNRITDERNLAPSYLRRVAGTDLWHLTYRLGSDWRASYSFLPQRGIRPVWLDGDDQRAIRAALDQGQADPRNPETCRNRPGTVMSVVSLPDAPAQPWVARREGVVRGTVTERTAPDGRRAWVYEPPSSVVPVPPSSVIPAKAGISSAALEIPGQARDDGRGDSTPVVLVLDGEVWTSTQDLATTMDNLIADGAVCPAHLVMLDSGGKATRWEEMGGPSRPFDRLRDRSGPGDPGDYLIRRLLPWARQEYPISSRREEVVVAGLSLGGLVALRTALEHPDEVGGLISQSASLWQDNLARQLATADAGGLRAYLEVGSQEWVLAGPNHQVATRLAQAGADVRFVEYNGGHDYACWRGGLADGLRHLLPPR